MLGFRRVTLITLKQLEITITEDESNESVEFTERTAKVTKKRQEDVGKAKGKGIDVPTDELEDLLDYPE